MTSLNDRMADGTKRRPKFSVHLLEALADKVKQYKKIIQPRFFACLVVDAFMTFSLLLITHFLESATYDTIALMYSIVLIVFKMDLKFNLRKARFLALCILISCFQKLFPKCSNL